MLIQWEEISTLIIATFSCYFIPFISTIPLPILSLGSLNGVAYSLFYFYLFLKTFFMIYLLELIAAGRFLVRDLRASKDRCCCLWCPPTQPQLLLCLLHQIEHCRVSLFIRWKPQIYKVTAFQKCMQRDWCWICKESNKCIVTYPLNKCKIMFSLIGKINQNVQNYNYTALIWLKEWLYDKHYVVCTQMADVKCCIVWQHAS